MTAFSQTLRRSVIVLTGATLLALAVARPVSGQILPWEVTVAEIEAGRLRNLAERLSKQNVLYHLRVADVAKRDLIRTANEIEQIIETLENGVAARSIPAPWTKTLVGQVSKVDSAWSPLRKIAHASPYQRMRISLDFLPRDNRRGDPLLLRYFDTLCETFITESVKLMDAYDFECRKTGLVDLCPTARSSGYAAMLIERAAKEAVYVVANIEPQENRTRLKHTIGEYLGVQRTNNTSEFFRVALNPERGVSAKAAGELLQSLREDWSVMEHQFTILSTGDEKNFDLRILLLTQTEMVNKVERLTAALVRYANLAYGS
jgi:hypothetical protein